MKPYSHLIRQKTTLSYELSDVWLNVGLSESFLTFSEFIEWDLKIFFNLKYIFNLKTDCKIAFR